MSTGNLNVNGKSAKRNIRFEHGLIEAIEAHKDELIPFSAWVKQACKEKLERDSGNVRPNADTSPQVHTDTKQRTEPKAKTASPKENHSPAIVGANAIRAQEIKNRVIDGLNALTNDERKEIAGARYPKSEVFKALGGFVSKDSIAKYWDELILPVLEN